jgi:hypothetical protein
MSFVANVRHVIVTLFEVAEVRLPLVALKVYVPALPPVILQPPKLATPLVSTVTGLGVQLKVPPLPALMARATDVPYPVTVLPLLSSAVSLGCVGKALPRAAGPWGWVLKTNCVAVVLAVMETEFELAEVTPPLVAFKVYVPAAAVPSMSQVVKPATPVADVVTVLLLQLRLPWALPPLEPGA